MSTSYLINEVASKVVDAAEAADAMTADMLLSIATQAADGRRATSLGQPVALHLELQPPPSSVARGLRLRAGQPAAMVTVRFDDRQTGRAVALTVAALRPDLFRIVIDSPANESSLPAVAVSDAFDDGTGLTDTTSAEMPFS